MVLNRLLILFCATSLFASEEKVAELFVVRVAPRGDSSHFQDVETLFKHYPTLGGVILKDANPEELTSMIDWLYTLSPHPKLVMTDAEWGLGMRLHDVMSFPKQAALGAIQDETLLYELGREIGRQALALGIDVNLAPVVDVNTNPKNPIINVRSFGSDPINVARKGALLSRGMRDEGLFTVIKHFPGHGDASIDSHYDLPIIRLSREEMEAHLYPFKKILDEKETDGVMTAHLFVEALQDRLYPATMDPQVVKHILRDQWGYDGLIITDALNMAALTKDYSFEEIAIGAFIAGHDILLYGDHIAPKIKEIVNEQVPRAIQGLTAYIKEHGLEKELDKRLKRIRDLKKKKQHRRVPKEKWPEVLFSKQAAALKEELYRQAIRWKGAPYTPSLTDNISYTILGEGAQDEIREYLSTFAKEYKGDAADTLIVVCLGPFEQESIPPKELFKKIVWLHLASPYIQIPMEGVDHFCLAYENVPETRRALFVGYFPRFNY